MAAGCAWVVYREQSRTPEQRERALARLRELLAAGEFCPEQGFSLAVMAISVDEVDLARWVLREWERQAPQDPRILEQRARAEWQAGSYGTTVRLVDQILQRKLSAREAESWTKLRDQAVEKLRSEAQAIAPGGARLPN